MLDACCGSGVIGAALRARGGAALEIHLLDADAVALDAARANVPSAARAFLCGGWPDTATAFPKKGKPKKYDWIVTNPPVHHGQPDDFSVVRELISGARSRLTKSGVLWLVAQEQVPYVWGLDIFHFYAACPRPHTLITLALALTLTL